MLVDKYRFSRAEAKAAAAFLLPILDFDPQRRATAQDCLAHPWLAGEQEQQEDKAAAEETKDVPVGEAGVGEMGK